MAEYKEGQGIKTHRDDDVKIKIVDGQSGDNATDVMTVAQPGDAVVADSNDYSIPILAKDEDGNYCHLQLDGNCNLKVVAVPDDDDVQQHGYNLFSAVSASGGTSDFDTVVTSTKKVSEVEVLVSSPGCFKYELGLWDGVSTFTVYHAMITQPACSSFKMKMCIPEITGDGTLAIRLRATNNDDTDNDAFGSICFVEKL